jgi:hypothetical protein
MFVVAATEDQLGFVPLSGALYEKSTVTPPYILDVYSGASKKENVRKNLGLQHIFLEICQGRNPNPARRSRLEMVILVGPRLIPRNEGELRLLVGPRYFEPIKTCPGWTSTPRPNPINIRAMINSPISVPVKSFTLAAFHFSIGVVPGLAVGLIHRELFNAC